MITMAAGICLMTGNYTAAGILFIVLGVCKIVTAVAKVALEK
jgi:hypothetical protein